MRLAAFALLVAPAAPAAAQDLAADYAAAAAAFALPGAASLSNGDILDDDAARAMVPALAGIWVALFALSPEPEALDPALLAEACWGPAAVEIEPLGPRSFGLRRSRADTGASFVLRHDWVVGNTFQRSVLEEEYLAVLGLTDPEATPPLAMAAPGLRGDVLLYHPMPDILVMQAPRGILEIFGRCPA